MRGYTCSSALSAIREILYHPVKDDVELVSEIKGVLREIEDAAEPSSRASAQVELAATVPAVAAANTASDAICGDTSSCCEYLTIVRKCTGSFKCSGKRHA